MSLAYQNQMGQYKRMKIESATPEMLILMLYDGAIKNICLAQEMILDKARIEQCNNHFVKAQNIITELMVSLNFEVGGDIARNLFNIYEFMNYSLAQANINKSSEGLDTIVTMLKDLRNTWQEVIRMNKEKYPNGIPAAEQLKEIEGPAPQLMAPIAAELEEAVPMPDGVAPAPSATPSSHQAPSTGAGQNRFKQIYGKALPRKS